MRIPDQFDILPATNSGKLCALVALVSFVSQQLTPVGKLKHLLHHGQPLTWQVGCVPSNPRVRPHSNNTSKQYDITCHQRMNENTSYTQ